MSFHNRASARRYYQGWLHVKQNQAYQKMFAELRAGRKLQFYVGETRATGAGNNCQSCLDLRTLRDILMQNDKRPGTWQPEYLLVLKFNGQADVKLRFQSTDDRSIWERYLRAVGLSKLPQSTTHLLPGQIHEMQDIIQNEREQESQEEEENYLDMNGTAANGHGQSPWYYPHIFSRHDAEQILQQSSHGNMLVRRRQQDNERDEYSFAVSAVASTNPYRFSHYRVKWCSRSSVFEVALADGPPPKVKSLDEVVTFFEKRSNQKYKRLTASVSVPSHDYEEHLFPTHNVYVNVNNSRKSHR